MVSGREQKSVIATVNDYLPAVRNQIDVTRELNLWIEGRNEPPKLKEGTESTEYRALREFATTPWARLIVTGIAQSLYVDGYREGKSNENSKAWSRLWQPNGMDAKQVRIHRAALGHGLCYGMSMPGVGPDGKPMAVMTGVSAMRGAAFYRDDPLDSDGDEWPEVFFLLDDVLGPDGNVEKRLIRMVDEEFVYTLEENVGDSKSPYTFIDKAPHGSQTGAPPVVRFANMLDLDGKSLGEVEPLIPLLGRVDQSAMDRLVIQRNSAWQVRYATGMVKPSSTQEQAQMAAKLRTQDLLMAESPDARFGVLPPSPLGDLIAARDSDIRDLAAASQTPPHHLLGLSPNVGADGLVEAQRSLMAKVEERKSAFGNSWEQWLRLAAAQSGMDAEAIDYNSEVRWRDTESRSLSQVADALGKLATNLKVPVTMLWERLPDWTDQDTERAKEELKKFMEDEDLSYLLDSKSSSSGSSASTSDIPSSGAAEQTTPGSGGTLSGRNQTATSSGTGRRYGDDWDGDGKPG